MNVERTTPFGLNFRTLEVLFARSDEGLCLGRLHRKASGAMADFEVLEVDARFLELAGLTVPKRNGTSAKTLVFEPRWINAFGTILDDRRPKRLHGFACGGAGRFEVLVLPGEEPGQLALIGSEAGGAAGQSAAAKRESAQAIARLDEVNHRVMNSLSMIASLIALEARTAAPEEARTILQQVRARILAVANLYRTLTVTGTSVDVRIDLYLRQVVDALTSSVGQPDRIAITLDVVPWSLRSEEAVLLGLIVNELATNALKHAFDPEQPGTIDIVLAPEVGGGLILRIADSGRGRGQAAGASGVGRTLLDSFAMQLGGTVETIDGAPGLEVILVLPKLKSTADDALSEAPGIVVAPAPKADASEPLR